MNLINLLYPVCLLLVYILGYIYIFIAFIFPLLNQPLTNILSMTLWQLIAIIFFFIPGLGIFLFCVALLGLMIFD